MDTIKELFLGLIFVFLGTYLIRYGWINLFSKGSVLSISDRFEIWLTKKFQGDKVARQVETKKTDFKSRRVNGVNGLIFGTLLFICGLYRILEAWRLL